MAEYTINELEEISGVARRNIHFYVQQGLLPPAEGAGLAARYGEEHLLRLRAIPMLRLRGLRLDAIRETLADMRQPELQQLLAHPQPVPPVKDVLPPAPQLPPAPGTETLIRYDLAPGIQLLVESNIAGRRAMAVAELVRYARDLFLHPLRSETHGGNE